MRFSQTSVDLEAVDRIYTKSALFSPSVLKCFFLAAAAVVFSFLSYN